MKVWFRSACVVGFATGGFLDGILLHQILQWHHLLSLVPGIGGLREQVLWDGYFHAVMYVAGALGLAGLWRRRAQLQHEPWQALIGAILLGFAGWHVIDSVLSHWLIGIHRIRIDSPDPLMWDLIWLAGFGIVPGVAGYLLLKHPPARPPRMNSAVAILLLAVATGALAAWSLRPSPDQRFTTVVFAPWISGADAFAAIEDTGARLVWVDPAFTVMVVHMPVNRRAGLYAAGALLVSGSLPAGCIDWSRPGASKGKE